MAGEPEATEIPTLRFVPLSDGYCLVDRNNTVVQRVESELHSLNVFRDLDKIKDQLSRLHADVAVLDSKNDKLFTLTEKLMSTIADLSAALDDLKTTVTTKLTALEADITALKGQVIDQATIDALAAKIGDIKTTTAAAPS